MKPIPTIEHLEQRSRVLEAATLSLYVASVVVLILSGIEAPLICLIGFGALLGTQAVASVLAVYRTSADPDRARDLLAVLGAAMLALAALVVGAFVVTVVLGAPQRSAFSATVSVGGSPRFAVLGVAWCLGLGVASVILGLRQRSTGLWLKSAEQVATSVVTISTGLLALGLGVFGGAALLVAPTVSSRTPLVFDAVASVILAILMARQGVQARTASRQPAAPAPCGGVCSGCSMACASATSEPEEAHHG